VSVYLPKRCRTWYYDFWYKGRRYLKTTGQITREDAEDAERQVMRALRRTAAGLPALDTIPLPDTPRFSDWAAITLTYAKTRKKLKRPEQFAINLRMVLGFWGARPTKTDPIDEPAPYRDLRLIDPIRDPELLEAFEQWMDQRGISGPRKNHYRSACSQMYRVALLPANRKRSGVTSNPFAGVLRDRVPKRIRTFSHDQLRTVIDAAPWHVRVALAIGALAPKLRLINVLSLRWGDHVSADRRAITMPDHKTDRETGLPLVVPVSPELQLVLDVAWAHRRGASVVHYHGQRVRDIKTALKSAVEAAGLTFGRAGLTYHSLRHTMGTEFARMQLPEALRARLMGHSDLTTTQIYTHLVAADEVAPLAQLGTRMPIADLIGTPLRASGPATGPPGRRSKIVRKSRKRPKPQSRASAKTTR
jgi:integrase